MKTSRRSRGIPIPRPNAAPRNDSTASMWPALARYPPTPTKGNARGGRERQQHAKQSPQFPNSKGTHSATGKSATPATARERRGSQSALPFAPQRQHRVGSARNRRVGTKVAAPARGGATALALAALDALRAPVALPDLARKAQELHPKYLVGERALLQWRPSYRPAAGGGRHVPTTRRATVVGNVTLGRQTLRSACELRLQTCSPRSMCRALAGTATAARAEYPAHVPLSSRPCM